MNFGLKLRARVDEIGVETFSLKHHPFMGGLF
jgi:hypothetical protein